MRRCLCSVCIVLAFLCASSARAETTIRAEVDKTEITTDELLTYKLSVASTERLLPAPRLPSFEGFAIVSQAQSNTVSYQKGGMRTILVFAFILLPQQAATVTIEPAQIMVRGKAYASESLQVIVKQGVPRPQPRSGKSAPDRHNIPPEEKTFPEDLSSSQPRYDL